MEMKNLLAEPNSSQQKESVDWKIGRVRLSTSRNGEKNEEKWIELQRPMDTITYYDIEIPEREKETERTFEETMPENCPNLKKYINLHIQEAHKLKKIHT